LPTLDEALARLEPKGDAPSAAGAAPTRAAAPSGSSRDGTAMRLVEAGPAAAVPRPEPRSQTVVSSLEDVAALAEANRDLAFKIMVKDHVRLVRMERGRMEISHAGNAPR